MRAPITRNSARNKARLDDAYLCRRGINARRPHTCTARPLSEMSFRKSLCCGGGVPAEDHLDDEDIVATNLERADESDSESSAFLRQFPCAGQGGGKSRRGHTAARNLPLQRPVTFSMRSVLITPLGDLLRSFARLLRNSRSRQGKSPMLSSSALAQAASRAFYVRNTRRRFTSPA